MKKNVFGLALLLLAMVILIAGVAVAEKTGETDQVQSSSSLTKDKTELRTQLRATTNNPENDSHSKQDPTVEVIDNSQIQIEPEIPVGPSPLPEPDKTTAGEQIVRQVISHGGTTGISANFITRGTVSQAATGSGSGTQYSMTHGFWAGSGGGYNNCTPGDPNDDGSINVGDAVYMINYVFKGGPAPMPYPICSGDANSDCVCNVGDAVYLINYVFKGGPPPLSGEEWEDLCGSP